MMKLERMSCRRRLALMCDYLDGELPPAARRLIAAHRRSCLPCARVLASLKRTVAALRESKTAVKPTPAARRRLRARLAAL
ncbi:MAG: hypothetical protein A2506_00865 [Elusimicrobia bacterium RIFOXYD12_FULL_66_9]|nr:MAG: hypothetical protein A2506_00865 [Elusimicrobia bacterium RIFOXYD12_FULL_66_9]